MYRSILKRRISEPADFAALPRLELYDYESHGLCDAGDKRTQRLLDCWNARIGYKPSDIYALLSYGHPEPIDVRFGLDESEYCRVSVSLPWRRVKGTATLRLDSTGDFYTQDGENDYFEVPPWFQGQGIARAYMRNQIELLIALGGKFNKFLAGHDGVWGWSKSYAYPDPAVLNPTGADDLETHVSFLKRLDRFLEILRPVIPEDVYEKARTLSFSILSDKVNIIHLIDETRGVKISRPSMEGAISLLNPSNDTKGFTTGLREAFRRSALAGADSIEFSRLLLLNSCIHMRMDFGDDRQMHEIGRRAPGGWNTIIPV